MNIAQWKQLEAAYLNLLYLIASGLLFTIALSLAQFDPTKLANPHQWGTGFILGALATGIHKGANTFIAKTGETPDVSSQ